MQRDSGDSRVLYSKAGGCVKQFNVEWTCKLCGQVNRIRQVLGNPDEWPNKFDDLQCDNEECGNAQDVPTRSCTVTEIV
jgi:hypothetical protein